MAYDARPHRPGPSGFASIPSSFSDPDSKMTRSSFMGAPGVKIIPEAYYDS